jgi:hypothetical protein
MDLPEDDQHALCDACDTLFGGHWSLIKPYEHTSRPPCWERWDGWLEAESRDEDIFVESPHHALRELQISVQKGCRLCAIILGTLSERSINDLLASERFSEQKTLRTTYQLKPRGLDVMISLMFGAEYLFMLCSLLLTPTGGEPTRL